MSYEEDWAWSIGLKEGIDSVLAETSEIKYFYMNTRTDFAGGEQKAREAYALYQEFAPDGVLVADDNAQSMFVVPYLKDKVKTPVIFCGVNKSPEDYGYPASNVTGILERVFVKESLAFAQQFIPSINNVIFISKSSPFLEMLFQQFREEEDTYPVKVAGYEQPKTWEEFIEVIAQLKKEYQVDLIYAGVLDKFQDKDGVVHLEKEAIQTLRELLPEIPIVTDSRSRTEYGALCAVTVIFKEQSRPAAQMLLQAMQGTPVSELPIGQSMYGQRIINLDVLKSLKIKPDPSVLRGATSVTTSK